MPNQRQWSSALAVLVLVLVVGCGEGVQLIRESEVSGVVRYRYQERQGAHLSSNRPEAMDQAEKFCGGPFQILREGPTQGRSRVVEGVGGTDVIQEAWWGIRFRCQ